MALVIPELQSLIQQTAVSFSTSGDQTVVAALANKTTRILQLFLVIGGTTNLIFKSGATALTGTLTFSSGAMFMDYIHLSMDCLQGGAFIINSSQAVTVGGTVWYVQQ